MDNELKIFKEKVKKIPKGKAIGWLGILGFKLSLHLIRKKFFRKSKPRFSGSHFRFLNDKFAFNKLDFLAVNGQTKLAPSILKTFTSSFPNWHGRFEDEQDLHLLHRFKDLPFAAGDNSSFALLPKLVKDWKDKNHEGSLPGWHPYTLCERLVAFCWTLNFISEKTVTREWELEQLLAKTSAEHAGFLRNNFEFHLGHHNHLINNARALLTTATLLADLPEAADWKKYAIKVFKTEWLYQVLPDGVHAEQSVTYHFLLTRTLWEMKYLMEQGGEQFPFDGDLNKMIHYARIITRPDGTIPFLGHLTPDWHWKELVGLLPVWGYDAVPVSNLGKLYRRVETYKSTDENRVGVFLYPAAGQGIIRTAKLHAVLSCDPRCMVTVHGDQNFLGLDVWYAGTHLIRDAGLASYNLDAKRSWYESWQGQSTFSIDGFDPIVSNWRKRQLPKGYHKATSTLQGDSETHMLKASHTGYCRLPDPVSTEREINFRGEIDLCIVDRLQCEGQHTYCAKFHFGNNTVKQFSDRSIQIRDLNNDNIFELNWNTDLEFTLEENPFAIAYGEESNGITGVFKCTFAGNIKIEYLLTSV
jgi:hypothetical protein